MLLDVHRLYLESTRKKHAQWDLEIKMNKAEYVCVGSESEQDQNGQVMKITVGSERYRVFSATCSVELYTRFKKTGRGVYFVNLPFALPTLKVNLKYPPE